ncbi:MAG TPA: thioredoxin [Candidatus Thermoplasmatota archaeon]|nr:thioredoxin [Candidatus Thermoplasmatota archaeon]
MAGTAPTHPVDITDADFSKFVKDHGVVVVDCWAPWCGPCKRIAPLIEELAKEYNGAVAFGKLNTDENRATQTRFQIMSLPTLLVFKNGERVDQIVGFQPKDQIKAKIQKNL